MTRRLCALLLTGWLLSAAGCAAKQACYDCVQPGMSRVQVLKHMGLPRDVSKTAMHWQGGPYTDAWVFFDPKGKHVTGKYWQDPTTLRLDDVWPLLPPDLRY